MNHPQKPVVLLIDDNEEILEFLEEELGEKYGLLKATSAEEALLIIKEESIQLIISDVMMPGMDGFALCRFIKSDVEFSHIPIILLTAKNTLQSKIEGLEIGADAYIEKPFSPAYLQAQILNLLVSRNKLREYFASSPLVHIKSMAYSRADEHFLEDLHQSIEKHIADEELDVEKLARHMAVSRPTLYRKIKAISDLTPNELIHIARLKKAAELLAAGKHKMYEITEMVGYPSQVAFSRSFSKQFGMTPTEYQRRETAAGKK
ncbi:MAG TPA: response regulator [Flavisolibacter sp.]|jgi:DNA-binding response OmpR family regulator|nr:response regulator [Flavisolibacter sp.]